MRTAKDRNHVAARPVQCSRILLVAGVFRVVFVDAFISGWCKDLPAPTRRDQWHPSALDTKLLAGANGDRKNRDLQEISSKNQQVEEVAKELFFDLVGEASTATALPNDYGPPYTSLNLKKWEVYVDQSKPSLERGAGATLDAFWGLAPADQVRVQPAVLVGTNSARAPIVRCISLATNSSLEVTNVDSVDKVYRILTHHMGINNSTKQKQEQQAVVKCLKWKYKGNGHFEGNEIDLAIDAYNKALDLNVTKQEGMIVLIRAAAYMRRAARHQQELKEAVQQLVDIVPDSGTLLTAYAAARTPATTNAIFRRMIQDTDVQDALFRKTQYRHGLYQYALLQAAQDALRATQLLPTYATAWLRAGEILSELWKLNESAQYYERAMALDDSLKLQPIIDRLKMRQELLDSAKVYGWSDDTLRLALDVSR